MDPRILFIVPNAKTMAWLKESVSRLGYRNCSDAHHSTRIQTLRALEPELAILGPSLDDHTLMRCIHKLKIIDRFMPVFVCKANDSKSTKPESFPFQGIYDLQIGANPETISASIENGLKHRAEGEVLPEYPVLIGKSREILHIRSQIERIAAKDITVLITGESGTGKDLIARLIHCNSARKSKNFVKINCGALPGELLESEVFGFQRGAFTGAHKDKQGRIELADGGTLFIDEIGALSLPLQSKFLQVLEEKAFSRLGGIQDEVVDVRIVSATNSNLTKKIRDGEFRMDLFHRLYVMHIEAPPLRHRKEDIPLLTHFFLNKYCFELNRETFDIPKKAMDAFQVYQWPGNVRELENAVRRGIVLRDWDLVTMDLDLGQVSFEENGSGASKEQTAISPWGDDKLKPLLREHGFSLREIAKQYVTEAEKKAIRDALKQSQWNRKKAAQMLGVSYKTLLNRISEMNLQP